MKLLVGLGNPGVEYKDTRHNVGFWVLEVLGKQVAESGWQMASKFGAEVCDLGEVKMAKPQLYMNRSGEVVRKLVDFYRVDLNDLWVVHDDLDVVWGKYKIDFGRGPKVHRGVNSVEERLGSGEFWRVRVGVENRSRQEKARLPGEKYVLMRLSRSEREGLARVVGEVVGELRERLQL